MRHLLKPNRNKMGLVVVTDNDDRGQFAKYDRFAQRVLPKKGKLRSAYEAGKFGFKVAATWSKTPGGKRSLIYWATKSKYTRYGTAFISGGLIYNALSSTDESSQTGQTRNYVVPSRYRQQHCYPYRPRRNSRRRR